MAQNEKKVVSFDIYGKPQERVLVTKDAIDPAAAEAIEEAPLAEALAATARAIATLRGVNAPVGSEIARKGQNALEYLGIAYMILAPDVDNPAWGDE